MTIDYRLMIFLISGVVMCVTVNVNITSDNVTLSHCWLTLAIMNIRISANVNELAEQYEIRQGLLLLDNIIKIMIQYYIEIMHL